MPRLAHFALIMCLLATAAAVVSFVNGSWLGIVWVLLAGITSNMWWYYRRKARADAAQAGSGAAG
jgi:Flp pilus assembly protein TadB